MKHLSAAKRNCRVRQLKRLERQARRRATIRFAKRNRLRRPAVRPTRTSLGARRKVWIHQFVCPPILNLGTAYEDTIAFLMQFRDWGGIRRRSKFHLDMTSIQEISPAGALVLAAELDRWSALHNMKLRARDLSNWDPAVRALLTQMGFFALLEKPKVAEDFALVPSNVEFLPFQTGENSDGRPFLALRNQLEQLVGKLKFRLRLFQAVSEAITNVKHHAYSKKIGGNFLRRWWISASVDRAKQEVTVMVLDHGIGIPKTLPATLKEWAMAGAKAFTGSSNDAGMIEAAIELGRSSTKEAFRGHGLYRDIRSFVENHDKACSLRIMSNRGCYEISKRADGSLETKLTNHEIPFNGTFIEWKFGI